MAEPFVSDELWHRIEPLLPRPKRRRKRFPGRKPMDRRKVLSGILFILKTGIPWEAMPQELGYGCGMTCWNYLSAWQKAGVWERLHQVLLADLREADQIDWSRAAVDSSSVRALGGGQDTGPNPTDRRKLGSKHHVLTDAQGIPLATTVTAANVHDVQQLLPVVDQVPAVSGKVGHPRKRPQKLYGDRAYDSKRHRQKLKKRGIDPHIARRGAPHGSGLGIYRWVVERTHSWLHQFRRLRLRTDRDTENHKGFVALASAIICLSFL
jgi:transposase